MKTLLERSLDGEVIKKKMYKGLNNGDIDRNIIMNESMRTRGCGWEMDTFRSRKGIGKYWFTNREGDKWNKLNRYAVDANTIESFERRTNKFMDAEGEW